MCMLAFAVCVSHFPFILGGGRTRLVGREISRITRYADRVVHVDPLSSDTGMLLDAIDAPVKVAGSSANLAGMPRDADAVDVLLFNGNFNHSTDIQGLLETVRPHLGRRGRVVVAIYNWYFAWLFRLADRLGLRQGPPIITFITQADLEQLARLGGFELVRLRPVAYLPWHFFGLGSLLNVVMPAVPGLRWLSLVTVAVLRPIAAGRERPSLSIVIPARNERGNIEAALRRMPDFGASTEVIFVEGHSSDGTWDEIQRVTSAWDGRAGLRVRACQQTGKGKADAVRLGFSKATGRGPDDSRCRSHDAAGKAHAFLRGVLSGLRQTSSTALVSYIRWKARPCGSSTDSATYFLPSC